jgi:hypothetical protein
MSDLDGRSRLLDFKNRVRQFGYLYAGLDLDAVVERNR